jgi:hypothetical protein
MPVTGVPFGAKAAQCPNCFSFNSPEYLPEKKKKVDEKGILLTCATCGTAYRPLPHAA